MHTFLMEVIIAAAIIRGQRITVMTLLGVPAQRAVHIHVPAQETIPLNHIHVQRVHIQQEVQFTVHRIPLIQEQQERN